MKLSITHLILKIILQIKKYRWIIIDKYEKLEKFMNDLANSYDSINFEDIKEGKKYTIRKEAMKMNILINNFLENHKK